MKILASKALHVFLFELKSDLSRHLIILSFSASSKYMISGSEKARSDITIQVLD